MVEKITEGDTGTFNFTSDTLPDRDFDLTTTSEGAAGKDSETFSDLTRGTYDVTEDVPTGWDLADPKCSSTDSGDTSTPANINLNAGETITCTFTNTEQRGSIVVEKVSNGGTGEFTFKTTTSWLESFSLTTSNRHEQGLQVDR